MLKLQQWHQNRTYNETSVLLMYHWAYTLQQVASHPLHNNSQVNLPAYGSEADQQLLLLPKVIECQSQGPTKFPYANTTRSPHWRKYEYSALMKIYFHCRGICEKKETMCLTYQKLSGIRPSRSIKSFYSNPPLIFKLTLVNHIWSLFSMFRNYILHSKPRCCHLECLNGVFNERG